MTIYINYILKLYVWEPIIMYTYNNYTKKQTGIDIYI